MFLSFFLLFIYYFLQIVSTISAEEISLVRHIDGDIFTVKGSCLNACSELSSNSAVPYQRQSKSSNDTCVCQCNSNVPLFREDLHICVSDIHECRVTGFLSSSGTVENVPYVFLPQRGQIIYPQAEIQFQGVKSPVCGITGAQQLSKSGWLELRNLSSTESPFRLFKDKEKTFLQWIGDGDLKDSAEGKVVIVRLVCRDASPYTSNPGVFTPCVAFRIAGSPSKSTIREVTFVSTIQPYQGLSTTEYTAIGISSVILALIYISSVLLYLNSRKSRKKVLEEPEIVISNGRESAGLIKSNPLLAVSRHFESETNSPCESDHGEEFNTSDGESGFEKVTSAIIHPVIYNEQSEANSGTIIAERIPDEDVRIVETIDTHQHDLTILPGNQRRKLYFNPAYFDRQLLMAPPPAAIEFLLKIREVITIAKHKLMAKRFVPVLSGIPEEEVSDNYSSSNKRPTSVQSSTAKSRKSQKKCTGCPGCLEPKKTIPLINLPDNSRLVAGDSRIRAWLEDIKPPEKRWRNDEDNQKNFAENVRTFARSLENLKDRSHFIKPNHPTDRTKPLSTWKDNPPMLRTFQNITQSEIIGDDDRNSISLRSTKSMFEDTNYDRFCRTRKCQLEKSNIGNDVINAKIRKAIENSFIKQMEENAELENQIKENERNEQRFSPDGSSDKTNVESLNSINYQRKELPDMINELPSSKMQAKLIMDAVIKEMVNVKALENHNKINEVDYEVDSLERNNNKQKNNNDKIIKSDVENIGENKEELKSENVENNDEIFIKNYYNNLPELITPKNDGYSLVSEVYVNNGYASPENSDDSGPEISYKPEKPGYLTIKVVDSPKNYIKQDESEYEPDTLDRKPMKLKINGDVIYEKEPTIENYVDSLERPVQILLKSKGSFKDNVKNNEKGYGSLREIYQAKLRSNIDSNLLAENRNYSSWSESKYLTPDLKQAKRQRKENQPDVVPLPPINKNYDQSKSLDHIYQKNGQDRRIDETGDPTASGFSPVQKLNNSVGLQSVIKKKYKRKIDDSDYLSSTDSIESQKQLTKYEFSSVSETDEAESICDGASESGAESVGTDSVFFGNFQRISNNYHLSKSIDSGVDDIDMNNIHRQSSFNTSDSENESFVTVLSHKNHCNNNFM